MSADIERLRAAASAVSMEFGWYDTRGSAPTIHTKNPEDVAFIAAWSPPEALALLDRLEQTKHLPRALEMANERAERWMGRHDAMRARAEAAEAKVERVGAVAERWSATLAEVLAEHPSAYLTERDVAAVDTCLSELRDALRGDA